MHHNMAALLYTNEADKRGQNDILYCKHNYLLPVTMPHILNKQSEYLSALQDLKPWLQNTRVSNKDEQRITASLCLAPSLPPVKQV